MVGSLTCHKGYLESDRLAEEVQVITAVYSVLCL